MQKLKANKYNQYFINSVKKINDAIPNLIWVNYIENRRIRFQFKPLESVTEFLQIVKMMPNKNNFNFVNKFIIKDSFNYVGPALMKIINHSLMSGGFSSNWKTSVNGLVQKVPNSKKCGNYRPVNVLPLHEKNNLKNKSVATATILRRK